MAPRTTSKGQLVPRTQEQEGTLVSLVEKIGPQLAKALPRHLDSVRLQRIAITALRQKPKLMQCTPASFIGSLMSAAQLGLEPNTPLGQAYLIPFKRECTLIIGYQGMLELARRSGQVRGIFAHVVREGDHFHWELGLNPDIKHVPSNVPGRHKQKITHVYAVAHIKDGEPIFVVLTNEEIEARRARSKAADDGPWVTDYEAMCLKTGVRALWRWLPKSAEMSRAAALDDPEPGTQQSDDWDPDVKEALRAEGLEEEPEEVEGEIEEPDVEYPSP